MSKILSVASWNVEHFKLDPDRIGRVIAFLAKQNPDVFGLYEVEGAEVFPALVRLMPGYTFQITEGPQTQEILIGVRRGITAFITQRIEFRSGTTHMRPGQLVTVNKDGNNYMLLFLHLASGVNPRGMGLRDDMIERAIDFKQVLDAKEGRPGAARYLFLGDLNIMGMKYDFDRSIPAETELKRWDALIKKRGMLRLPKTQEASWSNGSRSSLPPSNLDHVVASAGLKFKSFKKPGGGTASIDVRGWTTESSVAASDAWIARYSDHALLYLEIVD
jgi:exonuclease III